MVEHKVFAEGVVKDIREYLSPENADVECAVVEQKKNNGQVCVGISFTKPGQKISPVIYIEPFYEEVRCGEPVEGIMQEIAQTAEESMGGSIPDFCNHIGEYDRVKEYLGVRLVNTKANRQELARLPHREMEDLSLIAVVRHPMKDKAGFGSIKVTEDMWKEWGVSADQMFEQAWKNEERPTLQEIEGLVKNEGNKNDLFALESLPRHPGEMWYILTNDRLIDGAALIAFPGVTEKLDELFPEGFFVVPSSLHETMIVPKRSAGYITPEIMGQMVRDINRTYVDKKDILSDRIYEYDKESGTIRQVPESMEREKGGVER